MEVVKIDNRYFWEGIEEEVFPFPPTYSKKAAGSDFTYVNSNNIKMFKLDVEFWAVMANGYFYKFKTSPGTNQKQLSNDVNAGRIFIPPFFKQSNEN